MSLRISTEEAAKQWAQENGAELLGGKESYTIGGVQCTSCFYFRVDKGVSAKVADGFITYNDTYWNAIDRFESTLVRCLFTALYLIGPMALGAPFLLIPVLDYAYGQWGTSKKIVVSEGPSFLQLFGETMEEMWKSLQNWVF